MSTIAYRDGVMAADTLNVSGNLFRETKKLYRADDAIIGVAGHYGDVLVFVEWWRGGHDMSALPQFIMYRGNEDAPDIHALVLHSGGLDIWSEHFQSTPVADGFFAIGSGAMAALAAMHMGASAEKAVEVAMLVDLHTGGRVESECLE